VSPYGYGYYPGYAYGPGYAVAPVSPCAQPSYDAYGNPIRNPACYPAQQPYVQQQYQQYPAQHSSMGRHSSRIPSNSVWPRTTALSSAQQNYAQPRSTDVSQLIPAV